MRLMRQSEREKKGTLVYKKAGSCDQFKALNEVLCKDHQITQKVTRQKYWRGPTYPRVLRPWYKLSRTSEVFSATRSLGNHFGLSSLDRLTAGHVSRRGSDCGVANLPVQRGVRQIKTSGLLHSTATFLPAPNNDVSVRLGRSGSEL